MFQVRSSGLYVVRDGKLVLKEKAEDHKQKVISYKHTVRPPPDEYYTETIKEYRKEISTLNKNYTQLQKAYWHLMGYSGQFTLDSSNCFPSSQCNDHQRLTAISSLLSNQYKSEQMSPRMKEANSQMLEEYQRINSMKLKLKVLNQFTVNNFDYHKKMNEKSKLKKMDDIPNSCRARYHTQGQDDFERELQEAFEEIEELKDILESVNIKSSLQIKQMKTSYEEHIKKLEQILQRQRNNNTKLTKTIGRMREEISSKDQLIKNKKLPTKIVLAEKNKNLS